MPDTLKDKSYRQYTYVSRYITFPYYYHKEDDKYIYGTTSYLNDTTPFVMHKVEMGDNPDKLALKYYNNPTLYWVILDYNRIQDPFAPLNVGDYLKIPTLSNIKFILD